MSNLSFGKPRSIKEALLGPDILNLFHEPRQGAATATTAAVAPTVEPQPPMPMPDDESAQAARRRSIAAQRSRRGRVSTIFTQPEGQGLGG